MSISSKLIRHTLAAAFVAAGLVAGAAQASKYLPPFVKSALVQVDVYDRRDRTALPIHSKDGRQYIVGTPGHEYAVRIRNCTGARVLVVTSVDGVNVISGDTAAPSQSGYVLEPWGSVEIAGWRKNMERTAAFYFTDLGNSYAARTGRPGNVGVVGVAVFQEKPARVTWRDLNGYRSRLAKEAERLASANGAAEPEAKADAPMPASAPPLAAAEQDSAAAPSRKDEVADDLRQQDAKAGIAQKRVGKLGTGHGRSEHSRVTLTQFERASESPAETIAIQYDRRENLIAMGVLPPPRLAYRTPDPFPGTLRFAPDPNR